MIERSGIPYHSGIVAEEGRRTVTMCGCTFPWFVASEGHSAAEVAVASMQMLEGGHCALLKIHYLHGIGGIGGIFREHCRDSMHLGVQTFAKV